MIHDIVQYQDIVILHIDPLVLDHLQFPGDHLKNVVLVFVMVIENSIPKELHHVQETLNFITNEAALDLITILFSERIAIVRFLDPTLEIDCT